MKTATITEAKNGLSALIDRVRAGESVHDHGSRPAGRHPRTDRIDSRRVGPARAFAARWVIRSCDVRSPDRPLSGLRLLDRRRQECRRDPPGRTANWPMRFWDSSAIVPLLVGGRRSNVDDHRRVRYRTRRSSSGGQQRSNACPPWPGWTVKRGRRTRSRPQDLSGLMASLEHGNRSSPSPGSARRRPACSGFTRSAPPMRSNSRQPSPPQRISRRRCGS